MPVHRHNILYTIHAHVTCALLVGEHTHRTHTLRVNGYVPARMLSYAYVHLSELRSSIVAQAYQLEMLNHVLDTCLNATLQRIFEYMNSHLQY